jgi:FMN phosphatase YigB (HAD superfamily)
MKKIVFFDGDGTLWYPKKTKRLQKPHWVYQKHKNYKPHLVLTPTAISTLRALRRREILIILLSTHPHPPKEADAVLRDKVVHFKLDEYFNTIIATKDKPHSKTQHILHTLKRFGLPKSQGLMVGDSYKWDYQPARQAGIDAVLLDSDYRKADHAAKKVKRVIENLSGVLEYI